MGVSRREGLAPDAKSAFNLGLGKAFGIVKSDWVENENGILVKDLAKTSVSPDLEIKSDIWRIKSPSVREFFGMPNTDPKKAWFYEPLYPLQLRMVEKAFGNDSLTWDTRYDELHVWWGKGAGKDRTIAKMMALVVVKLLCMVNPQKGLDQMMGGGTVGVDSPIDLINVSKDQTQAKVVFFKNFKSIIKKVKNPHTGKNFFEEIGVDLRDGKAIQTNTIEFPHEITCHSLNSKQYAGEGLNLFFVVADEIGASPAAQIRSQLTAIRETIDSRFPKIGTLVLMSFKYADNCPMSVEYEIGKGVKRIYSTRAASWEVNPKKNKKTYERHYKRNPNKAMMTYECRSLKFGSGGYIRQKFLVPWCFNSDNFNNPFIDDVITTNSILSLRFKDDFVKRMSGKYCAIHVDLAKGKVEAGGDTAGIAMSHPEEFLPKIHPKSRKMLGKMGFAVDADEKMVRKGIIVDFALQITANRHTEVQFADIIQFILYIKRLGIRIYKVTYDGFSSIGELQRLLNLGINAAELSVDRTSAPYDTLKDSMYRGLVKGYGNYILERELKELIVTDKGKIDHPETSWLRLEQEGYELGSKDVADCVAGSSYTCMKEIPISCGIFW